MLPKIEKIKNVFMSKSFDFKLMIFSILSMLTWLGLEKIFNVNLLCCWYAYIWIMSMFFLSFEWFEKKSMIYQAKEAEICEVKISFKKILKITQPELF